MFRQERGLVEAIQQAAHLIRRGITPIARPPFARSSLDLSIAPNPIVGDGAKEQDLLLQAYTNRRFD